MTTQTLVTEPISQNGRRERSRSGVAKRSGVEAQAYRFSSRANARPPISLIGHSQQFMSTTEQRFQSFITRVRPHRVAVLTDIADPHWQESCLGIIEFFTKLWGGTHCVIVPTDGKTIDETFWAILSSQDPDIIYRYQRTGVDEQKRSPEDFEKIVSAEVVKYVQQAGLSEDQVRGQIENALLEAPFDPWTITDELRDQMMVRLAPFHFRKQPLHGMPNDQLNIYSITRGSSPHHPLTSTLAVLKSSNQPKIVAHVVHDVPPEDAPPPLWIAAASGSIDMEYSTELTDSGVVLEPVMLSALRTSERIKLGTTMWADTGNPLPIGLANVILTPVMASRARRFDLPTVVVVGDTVRDFCLYHALYWQCGRAVWLPSWFLSEPDNQYPERLMTVIRVAENKGRIEHNERLSFVSYSLDSSVLQALKDKIIKHMFRTSITIDDITRDSVGWAVEFPSRVYTEGNLGDVTNHLLFNNTLPGAFDSPLPRTLSPINPLEHRWLVDITFMEHLVPRHPALGTAIVLGPNVGDVRSGADGVSYMCPGMLVMGSHMETNLLRPNIRVPDAEEIFRIVLEDCDYRSKTSDKGRYEDTTVRKFGGLDKAGYALWSYKNRALLMKYLDKSESVKGVFTEGVYLKSDQRRYMDFASIDKIMQNPELSYGLIDEYVEKGVFYRGYIFVCENCSDSAWHSIADVDQSFTCNRCGLKQVYKHQHWKHPNEPLWFYKLDEMIYLMLTHNGHVPLLTLNNLRISSKESFLFRPELRILPKGSHKTYLEMDICCIANGKLCIGEAKSNGDLKGKDLTALQTATRYRDLALKIGASMVVFSTTDDSWNPASVKAMDDAFGDHPHIDVKRWTAATLYG